MAAKENHGGGDVHAQAADQLFMRLALAADIFHKRFVLHVDLHHRQALLGTQGGQVMFTGDFAEWAAVQADHQHQRLAGFQRAGKFVFQRDGHRQRGGRGLRQAQPETRTDHQHLPAPHAQSPSRSINR